MTRLQHEAQVTLGHHLRYIDFENDYLKGEITGARDWMTFLAQDIYTQKDLWSKAWAKLAPELGQENIVLGLHGTYVSGPLGLRCAIDIPKLCDEFRPTLIITLIDDVYAMWARTEARAQGEDRRGRPTFEQLLVARRAEMLLGDLIQSHTYNNKVRHVLCATGNSIVGLLNLIIFDAAVTYLSFPISEPRKMLAAGRPQLRDTINLAHQSAAEHMRNDRSRCYISPLSIDELPLLNSLKNSQTPLLFDIDDGDEEITFDAAQERWLLSSLWSATSSAIVETFEHRQNFPKQQVRAAAGLIQTDVGWRDRRLVMQSDSLAVVCPKPPDEDRLTRGVRDEILTALPLGIPVFFWQPEEWDRTNFLDREFPPAGSMGIGQTDSRVKRLATLDELIAAIP